MPCKKCNAPLGKPFERQIKGYIQITAHCLGEPGHTNYLESRPMTPDEQAAFYHSEAAPREHQDRPARPISVELFDFWRRWQAVRL